MLLVLYFQLVLKNGDFNESKTLFMKRVLALIYGSGSPYECDAFSVLATGPIWFLLSLFIGLIIVRVCADFKWGFIPVIICMAAGYITSTFVWLPLSIQAGMVDAGYIYLGYLLKVASNAVKEKIKDSESKAPIIIEYVIEAVIMIGCFVALWFYLGKYKNIVLLSSNTFDNGYIDFLMTIGASLAVLLFCKLILSHIWGLKHALMYIGRNTLLILCFHSIDTIMFDWSFILDRFPTVTGYVLLLIYALKIALYIVLVVIWNGCKALINKYLIKQEEAGV